MQEKYGNLQGRKYSKTKQLQKDYKQNQPKDRLDLLHKSKRRKNPTPPKLYFVSPPRLRGGVGGGVLGTFARSLFISPKLAQALAAITKEIASEQDRVLLVGVQTEDISVQLFGDAVSGRAK
ncbi:hypothetical protein [Nostoc sp.]|uniref:hypothetical protein n=1 Tax=Nostoc sp. TaxID=1180 RepID=UPI002FF69E55